ncbi:MAG: hypothetical protein JWR63_3534, partial [Conexibacter sp.]|nr:hypothetical protein [Conexibacter sp.]
APATKPDPATHCIPHTGPQTPTDLSAWDSKLAPSSKVTFWWPKSHTSLKATATSLAQEMDQTIEPKLTALMGRKPPSDGSLDCAHGATGGVDVYLVDVIDKPWNTTVDPGAKGWTSVYTCNKNAPNPSAIHLADWSKETLAHEYFHVLQNAFADKAGCDRPNWLEEGTAEWAVEYTYKHSLTDDQSAQWLQAYEPPLNDIKKTYDAWPFWYDVQKHVGAEAIPAVFAALEYTDPLAATDQAIGGFRARWPDFARDAYNRDPVKTFQTDAWTKTTWKVEKTASLLSLSSGQDTKDVPYPGSQAIQPLARTYDDYAFADGIRKITISGLPASADYHLHGLLHMADGSWQERDLTGGATFCRDKPEEDVQEVVLIASNASVTTPVASSAKLTVAGTCGLPHFKVIAASFSNTTTGGMSGGNQPCGAGVGGTEDYGGHLGAPLSDPDLKLSRRPNGDLEANLFFDVTSDGTMQLAGCTDPYGAELPCLKTRSNGTVDHRESMGFRVDVDHAKPTVAQLHWLIEEASIGFFDADDSVCNVDEFYQHVTAAEQDMQIPYEQLQHGTHTFENAGTKTWKVDQKTGYPADLTLSWSYTVTLQVVDADGNPIP